ncbi:RIOK1 [Symbiodinium natans]|uniref:Serine/threonine-protein kinase RIO1 n=1 Tax=Symbiodinium natans TaxID=878477 RepID=A0A812GKG6_9DINO|nr:RIOK1 [Symbiodinium natans]
MRRQCPALREVAEGRSIYEEKFEKHLRIRAFSPLVPLPPVVRLGEYLLQWLWTYVWHLPLQTIRLTGFFTRLVLYVVFLFPGMIFGLVYWAFAGEDIISVNYKEKGGRRHTCDIYLPSYNGGQPQKAPVMIIIPGGAFILGHKGYVTMLCRALRSVGFLCIAVDYRYWPQTTIDGMVEDVSEAVAWSMQHCETYGGDRKQIGMLGLSSGAHVAALLLTRRAAQEKKMSLPGQLWSTSDLLGFIGLGGIYELHGPFMSHLHAKGIDFVLQRLVMGESEAVRESRSPSLLIRRDKELGARMPPVLLVHGTSDKIVPQEQSETFERALSAAGVDVELIFSKGEGHNDPVIHCPLMSNHNTVRAILLAMQRWSPRNSSEAVQRLQARVNFDPLPRAGSMSHAAQNSAVQSERKAAAFRNLGLTQDSRATVEQVLDSRTMHVLSKFLKRGLFDEIHGCISTGKEANVYYATSGDGIERAVKVYKTSILVFKDRARYVEGEFRFRQGYCKGNPRKMVAQWAEKEMRNLRRLAAVGIPCPEVLDVRQNVLVMEFLGQDGNAAPRLKDAEGLDALSWDQLYMDCALLMRAMMQRCKLVHGDLSEYNMLYNDAKLYIIDVSQSVESDHPQALDFLKRDCVNVNNFFAKRMSTRVLPVKRLFDFVVSRELPRLGTSGAIYDDDSEAFKALMDAAENGDFDQEDADDEVFIQTWIPSNLNQVSDQRSLDRELEKRQRGEEVLYERLLACDEAANEEEVASTSEAKQIANNSDDNDDESDSEAEHDETKNDGHKPDGMDKAEWKRKVKEEKREKRKDKVPKVDEACFILTNAMQGHAGTEMFLGLIFGNLQTVSMFGMWHVLLTAFALCSPYFASMLRCLTSGAMEFQALRLGLERDGAKQLQRAEPDWTIVADGQGAEAATGIFCEGACPALQAKETHAGGDALEGALSGLRRNFLEVSDELEQWKPLLERMNDRMMLIEDGLESAQDKVDIVSHSPAAPALWLALIVVIFAALLLGFIGIYCIFTLRLSSRPIKEVKRPALRAVLHALAMDSPAPDRRLDAEVMRRTLGILRTIAPPVSLGEGLVAAMQREQEQRAAALHGYSRVHFKNRRDFDGPWDVEASTMGPAAEVSVALEAMDVRIRQRMLNLTEPPQLAAFAAHLLEELTQAPNKPLPEVAEKAGEMVLQAFTSPEDHRALIIALNIAARALPGNRWRFKEASLCSLMRLGADSRAIVALLLHDLDECLGQSWAVVSKVFACCPELGEEVVNLIDEKKRLEQLALLLYLRALAEDSAAHHGQVQLAASQLTRLLYLRCSKDFRAAMVEIAEVEQILRNLSTAVASRFGLPDEGRALARCALDLHVPLAHGLGFDALAHKGSVNERITPSLENRALRLYFPEEYSMIEAWMREEDELLNRTLQRCLREVRRALDADSDVRALAVCKVRGRVKSVYSIVKKLLRHRGVSREDLKAQAIKDLLAVEVVVDPDPLAEVPQNPEWLAEEWRERAACFAVLDALQRYAKTTKGWSVLPDSTKDYITKSKKSGYRALHITLCTNVTTQMPKASSRAIAQLRTVDTMTCKLEVHVFSGSMKQKERKGLASHHLYKAFELGPDEIFASLGGRAADSIAPSELRRAVFPLERLHLFGEAFSADHMDREFRELCSSCDRSQDGRLTFVDVQKAQQQVSTRLEDFRRALEQRNANWWVHGVQTGYRQSLGATSWDWAKYAAELDPQQKVSMLHKALDMTKDAHAGQVRKSGDPYWTHPLAVADILARALLPPDSTLEPRWQLDGPALEQDAEKLWPRIADGPDDIFAMYTAALLHDTVEDTSVTLEQIEDAFGPVVASLVDGVTKASQASCTKSRASRSAQDLRKVLTRAAQDVRVLIIKFADRLHNMRTLAEETRAVYVPLAERLGVHIWKTEFEELCCQYLNGCAYEEVLDRNRRSQVARQRHRRYIQQYIRTMMVEMTSDSILEISVREEPPHTQLRRWADRPETDTPQPIPRVRIVTKDRDACWACLGRIHSILPPMPGRLRDYISSPKENLYMCLHTTVLMDGTAVEVYILSLEMEWVAEFGVGAFWRHNEDLQRSETGRSFLAALHSTWILQACVRFAACVDGAIIIAVLELEESTKPRAAREPSKLGSANSLELQFFALPTWLTKELLIKKMDCVRSSTTVDLAWVEQRLASRGVMEAWSLLQRISKVASDFAGGTGSRQRDDSEATGYWSASFQDSSVDVRFHLIGEEIADGGELLAELHRAYSEAVHGCAKASLHASLSMAGSWPAQAMQGQATRCCALCIWEALREKVAVFTPTGRVLYLPRDATPLDFAVWNLGAKKGLRAEAAFIDSSEATLNTRLREGQTVLVHLHDDEKLLPPLEWSGVHLRPEDVLAHNTCSSSTGGHEEQPLCKCHCHVTSTPLVSL